MTPDEAKQSIIALLGRPAPNLSGQVVYTYEELDGLRNAFQRLLLAYEVQTALVKHHRAQVAEYRAKLQEVQAAYRATADCMAASAQMAHYHPHGDVPELPK